MTATDSQIAEALACAAVSPGVRSVLVFDATPFRLAAIANTLQRMIACVTVRDVASFNVGPSTTDDTFWGRHRIEKRTAAWAPGLLEHRDPALVTIRDLSTLNLEAQRTLVVAVGSECLHLERHGQSRTWAPSTFWLAAIARADVGTISPHLLDRFALRIDGADSEPAMTPARLRELLEHPETVVARELGHDIAIADLRVASLRRVAVDNSALDRVLAYFPETSNTLRRTLALARLATARAQMDATAKSVTPTHVDAVAELLGLTIPVETPAFTPAPTQTPALPVDSKPTTTTRRRTQPHGGGSPEPDRTIHPSDPIKIGDPVELPSVAPPAPPHPEDNAAVQREARSLVFPTIQQRSTIRATRGVAIGTMRTHELRDLAISATLLEAAKNRAIRGEDRIRVTPSDLFRYRRVAPVEHMLAVVLDYTALRGWEWLGAVLPYFREAYTDRASVCLVQVGARRDPDIRAHRFVARSLLAAPLATYLDAEPGNATPLAHGLDLAHETLRHTLQHGRAVAVNAKLVVVTDGRGNVPLDASRRGEVIGTVGAKGVDDAMVIAGKLAVLDRLQAIVIQPPPTVAAHLPRRLATAMKAESRVARRPKLTEAES